MEPLVYGDAGYFYIPDLNVQVPLYNKGNRPNAQDVVDRENSALLCRNFRGGHCSYVADHASQGFNKIKKCTLDTLAYIVTETSTQFYYCVGVAIGRNTGTDLVTNSGQRVSRIAWADLCAYCCNDTSGKNISMVFFKAGPRLNYPLFKGLE